MAKQPEQKSSGGLSVQTLLISAVAAVAAATVVPMIWEQGTIFATAMTPVVVALVSEGLRKPVQHVSTVAPRVARRSGTGAAVRRFEPASAGTRDPERFGARGEGPERFEPLPDHLRDESPRVSGDDPFGLRQAERRPRRHWKIAALTGLLAFVIAGAFITVTELATGGSVSGDRRTSLFGGESSSTTQSGDAEEKATPTATPGEEATPTPEATETPAPRATATPSPEAMASPAPAQSVTPAPTP